MGIICPATYRQLSNGKCDNKFDSKITKSNNETSWCIHKTKRRLYFDSEKCYNEGV